MNSILGYHTYSIYKTKTAKDGKEVLEDAFSYMDESGEIRVRPDKKNIDISKIKDKFFRALASSSSRRYRIEYITEPKGLRWDLRLNKYLPRYIFTLRDEEKPCSIKAKITPKAFLGITDYTTAANENDILSVERKFNEEAKVISPILGDFDSYKPSRVDYCINADVGELDIGCTAEQMITLIKRADISHFKELMQYDKVSRREKSDKHSLYLISGSVNINCYWPYAWQRKKHPERPATKDAYNVIRFEVQSKYSKIYNMLKNFKEAGCTNLTHQMLSDEISADTVRYYFHKTIGRGDYFTLENAVTMVQLKGHRPAKEQYLIDALRLVNRCRGISKAKSELRDSELASFKLSLHELNAAGINPVTVPKEWDVSWSVNQHGIKYLPNILNAFYDKIENGEIPITKGMKRHLAKFAYEKVCENMTTEEIAMLGNEGYIFKSKK